MKTVKKLLLAVPLCISSVVYAVAPTNEPPTQKPDKTTQQQFDCVKKYCKRMTSCEEACYKLQVCGHNRLDRDKDGIPCENICDTKCKPLAKSK